MAPIEIEHSACFTATLKTILLWKTVCSVKVLCDYCSASVHKNVLKGKTAKFHFECNDSKFGPTGLVLDSKTQIFENRS